MTTFEFDEPKSISNLEKHGIDFLDAQALWLDPDLVVVSARTEDEPRYLAIGIIEQKHWSAIYTPRGQAIRLISVRRSRNEEVAFYESE